MSATGSAWEGVKIHLGHSKRRDTPAFFAVMFLFTSDEDIYRRAGNCLCRRGAEFDYARLHEISPHDYTLYIAVRRGMDQILIHSFLLRLRRQRRTDRRK